MSEAARRGLRDTRACVAALMLSDREMQFEEVLEDEGFCARQVWITAIQIVTLNIVVLIWVPN